jgi:septum formation protein
LERRCASVAFFRVSTSLDTSGCRVLEGGMKLPKPLILASQSPRRIQLLRQIGWNPIVMPCDVPEVFDPAKSPMENAKDLALKKALCVAREGKGIIIGADTIVVLDGDMLSKPEDKEDAVRMLMRLSGRTHTVYTGVALAEPSGKVLVDVEATAVTFRRIPEEEIREYVNGGSPLDKAGAYGIQDDYGAVFVTRIEGCYYNVVGLPLAKLYQMMDEFVNHAS